MCFEIFTIKFPLNKIFYYLEVTLLTFKIVLFIMSVFFPPSVGLLVFLFN